jgi:tetratricopeptide (TPR) repeat protein
MHRLIAVLLLFAAPVLAAQDPREASAKRARLYMTAQQGQAMTEQEAAAAEAHVAENPTDLETRHKLLGYYKVHMSEAMVERKSDQVLWFIRNRPEDPILATAYADLQMPLEYKTWELAKAAWEEQIEAMPKNPRVLTNAARMAMRKEREMVTDLLQRACDLEPDNPEWKRRLAGVYEFRGFIENRLDDHKLAYVAWKDVYKLVGEQERLRMLPKMAMVSLRATEYDEAKEWADKAMASVEVLAPRNLHGEAINAAHNVYGRLALLADDIEGAKRHLLASAETPGSMRLNNYGPNLRLAQLLAVRGQRETVIEFLNACSVFWVAGRGEIEEWIRVLKDGDTPDFGGNLRL